MCPLDPNVHEEWVKQKELSQSTDKVKRTVIQGGWVKEVIRLMQGMRPGQEGLHLQDLVAGWKSRVRTTA